MKRLFKLLSVTLSVAFFSIMSLMTSCSDDNNAVQQVYYTFGFEQLSGGNELFSEMYKIEDAFKNEFNKSFGATKTPFVLEGTVEECDAKVKQACERATKSLEDVVWASTFTFAVTNANTAQTIYTASFGNKNQSTIRHIAM